MANGAVSGAASGAAQGSIFGIPGSVIGGGIGLLQGLLGGGGASDQEEALLEQQFDVIRQLIPEIQRQQQLQGILGLRNTLLSDPSLAQSQAFQKQANTLGIDLPSLTSGGVPLKEAVTSLAFNLLPRSARTTAGGGLFASTPQTLANLEASPRTDARFNRFGFNDSRNAGADQPLREQAIAGQEVEQMQQALAQLQESRRQQQQQLNRPPRSQVTPQGFQRGRNVQPTNRRAIRRDDIFAPSPRF